MRARTQARTQRERTHERTNARKQPRTHAASTTAADAAIGPSWMQTHTGKNTAYCYNMYYQDDITYCCTPTGRWLMSRPRELRM